ncbi:hypothetical protein BECAL_02169 [Bellilinea caldifistulae]|nr:hypothetical protein [Bellilinea caldifistulae]GAP10989.1 hypothetical protein BECAL_02169 [Bellilinea caldifistulae]
MNPDNENDIRNTDDTIPTPSTPVLPIVLNLDEETIEILLDDQIATGG